MLLRELATLFSSVIGNPRLRCMTWHLLFLFLELVEEGGNCFLTCSGLGIDEC